MIHRENIEWLNYWIEDANKSKKRIILIGDSVTRDCRKWLSIFIGKKYAVDLLAMSYSVVDKAAVEEIKHYFDTTIYEYEFILFNYGSHHGYFMKCSENHEDERKYEKSIIKMLDVLLKYNSNVVNISATPERKEDENGNIIENHNIEIFHRNNIVNKVSKEKGIPYIDIYSKMIEQKNIYLDWCHFKDRGYLDIVEEIIKKLFKEIDVNIPDFIDSIKEFDKRIKQNSEKKIYIYGNGLRAEKLKKYIQIYGKEISGIIVSEEYYKKQKEIYTLDDIDTTNAIIIVTPMDIEVWNKLSEKRVNCFLLSKKIYIFIEEYINAYLDKVEIINV